MGAKYEPTAVTLARCPRTTPAGWKVVVHFDSNFAPCRCVTHRFLGIHCTSTAWCHGQLSRYRLRCLKCGRTWYRAKPIGMNTNSLQLDAGHAEEKQARQRRRQRRRLERAEESFYRTSTMRELAKRRERIKARHRVQRMWRKVGR